VINGNTAVYGPQCCFVDVYKVVNDVYRCSDLVAEELIQSCSIWFITVMDYHDDCK
jgi:hypothetical protein